MYFLKAKNKCIILLVLFILIVLFMTYVNNFGAQNIVASNNNVVIPTTYIISIIFFCLVSSMILIYLFLSNKCKKNFKETFCSSNKIIIFTLALIISTFSLTFFNLKILNNKILNNRNSNSIKEINLNDYNQDLNITNSGEYILSGEFNNTIYINSNDKVILNLNNITINSSDGSCIVNKSENDLVINIVDGSINNLSDDGKSDYNGCIYSNGNLFIDGYGILNITVNQKKGEGISTINKDITINNGNINIKSKDDGINAGGDNGGTIKINGGSIFVEAKGDGIDSNNNMIINGGTIYSMGSSKGGDAALDTDNGITINNGIVIAIGVDMLELPLDTSKQNSIGFTLDEIEKNTLVTLLNDKDEIIVSFEAREKFKTLIISSNKIDNGKYYLYIDGKNSGIQNNYIYENGEYTKGTLLKEINVSSRITNIK